MKDTGKLTPSQSLWFAIWTLTCTTIFSQAAVAATASATPSLDTWPHIVTGERGTATVYQPQVVSWSGSRLLSTRIAVAVTPTGAKTASLGTLSVNFQTFTDLANRIVTLSNPQLVSVQFPSLGSDLTARIEERAKAILAGLGTKQVPLDMVLLSLRQQTERPPDVALSHEPPRIFTSARPASLIVFDGEPVMAPVSGTTLKVAVNTNWQIFFETQTQTWYLLNNGGWLAAPDVKGPWMPVDTLPPTFGSLPGDANFADVKKQIPGRKFTDKDLPTIFVSTSPAAIIVTAGPPKYTAIPGTSLQFVANTDAALFKDASGKFYYLVSGRWFSAPGLSGPWTFATPSLPPDFAKIPADGPRGFVLVSVPGTPQAQEALIQSQIPQEGTLNKATATLTVVYAGTPQFVPIIGTPMSYAANTSFVVIQASGSYYSCYQGAWFVAPTPNGPWALAASVPTVIYTIPPTCPVYPCTYVQVYASTPTTVTFGYTSGYTMGYVSAGVVVYGTGYYYPPYYYPAPMPIYYPYPYSYAGATYYNPTTGAWAHGGALYGPYGGVAKGGTAYNPTTGAWAQGGAVYGPYGGAGACSAYNPSTGSYAHGSAVWGPDGAAGNASWYNANTGRSGTTQQNSNAYGRWGSSTISGPNQTVHTQSQSDSRGSAGSFSSSTGAKGAGVSGAGGNSAGVVKGAGGDVYAGADGNVYKKTDSGWEKYDDGSWNSVQKPSQKNGGSSGNLSGATATGSGINSARESGNSSSEFAKPSSQGNLSGATERTSGFRSSGSEGGFGQLEQDRAARWGGAQRQQQFESMRGNYSGRAAGGAARGGFRR
ncbi:MAG TPA: hypothetical protein PLX89_27345 [Verrucomicrobiota bacterium]|nr:hypothetical protein [Verrucomicrobiota bacterium]